MSISAVQSLLSPALRHLSISILCSDMKSIVARCAALEDLSIIMHFCNTADQLSVASNAVRSCKRLVNLSCAPLDWAAWKHLSNIPTLLTVTIKGEFPSLLKRDSFKFAPFLKLTALKFLKSYTAAEITTIIQHSEFPSLQSFTMSVRSLTRAEAERFFRALSQCKACQTLKDIRIGSNTGDEQLGMSLTVIRQLLCFTQLQTLHLQIHHSIYFDNDLLVEAMSSWPHLRSLVLVGHAGLRQPTVTFRAIFAALRFCPHLNTLQVMIDTWDIDIDPTTESFQHTSLKRLRVGTSILGDARTVARIIFTMLPCIDQVDDIRSSWIQVNLHLKSLRSSAARDRLDTEAAPTI
ncbi:hypothetical protein DEU56DRAFT_914696 [Suillus clintonianus]|uniref:uncharacterized protein n=1 Tax=Suillus clintonianus TaxID=1904413 RepID=UPI001B85E9CE|nr:uncharacterized protein DEU56DRAFT_914696 [Suillus clintonianus]KAG2130700.1 hypothetical protein DEU56DRAFT_914696 [Suillus clintonianus]